MILTETFSGTEPPQRTLGSENSTYHQVLTDGRITVWVKRSGNWSISSDVGSSTRLAGNPINQYQSGITLTDAQIKALPTTAVEVVAAQGENTIIVPGLCFMYLNWVQDYGNIGDTGRIGVQYGTSGSGMLLYLQEPLGEVSNLLIDGASHPAFLTLRSNSKNTGGAGGANTESGIGQFLDDPTTINAAISIHAVNSGSHTGNYTGGDAGNRLMVSIQYTVFNILTGAFL